MMSRPARNLCSARKQRCCSLAISRKTESSNFWPPTWCPRRRRTTTCPERSSPAASSRENDDGQWKEIFRCDEHLKNAKGYLGLTPLSDVTGWRIAVRAGSRKGPALYFTPLKGTDDRRAFAAHRRAMESADQALSVARPHTTNISCSNSRRCAGTRNQFAQPHYDERYTQQQRTCARTQQLKLRARANLPKSSSGESCSACVPYLKRYPGAIALGMLCLLSDQPGRQHDPLTTGVITDVIAGSSRPFRIEFARRICFPARR